MHTTFAILQCNKKGSIGLSSHTPRSRGRLYVLPRDSFLAITQRLKKRKHTRGCQGNERMHRSYGLATRPSAKATWKEVAAKGPCRAKARVHPHGACRKTQQLDRGSIFTAIAFFGVIAVVSLAAYLLAGLLGYLP